MTGDQTSLEVSRRLAKVWPPGKTNDDKYHWWLVAFKRKSRECKKCHGSHSVLTNEVCTAYVTDDTYDASDVRSMNEDMDEYVHAHTISELETETRRMGLDVEISGGRGGAYVALRGWAEADTVLGEGFCDHLIDAWGNAIAEAKEKA